MSNSVSMQDIYRIIGKINSEGGNARVEQSGTGGWNLYLDRINPFDGKIEPNHQYLRHSSKREIYEMLIKVRFDPRYNPYKGISKRAG